MLLARGIIQAMSQHQILPEVMRPFFNRQNGAGEDGIGHRRNHEADQVRSPGSKGLSKDYPARSRVAARAGGFARVWLVKHLAHPAELSRLS